MSNEKYNSLINTLIERMNAGDLVWAGKSWIKANAYNVTTGAEYRGSNAFFLNLFGGGGGFLTFNQARQLGGNVKKGAHGYPVEFFDYATRKPESDDEEPTSYAFAKHYTVFRFDQVEGIDQSKVKTLDLGSISRYQFEQGGIAYPNGPQVLFDGRWPCYAPNEDAVHLPTEWHKAPWRVIYHELAHSTGHDSRLKRKLTSAFGTKDYAREELVADMTAALVCHTLGLEYEIDNVAAYLKSWAKVLTDDPGALRYAANRAYKAADLILGVQE